MFTGCSERTRRKFWDFKASELKVFQGKIMWEGEEKILRFQASELEVFQGKIMCRGSSERTRRKLWDFKAKEKSYVVIVPSERWENFWDFKNSKLKDFKGKIMRSEWLIRASEASEDKIFRFQCFGIGSFARKILRFRCFRIGFSKGKPCILDVPSEQSERGENFEISRF